MHTKVLIKQKSVLAFNSTSHFVQGSCQNIICFLEGKSLSQRERPAVKNFTFLSKAFIHWPLLKPLFASGAFKQQINVCKHKKLKLK